MSALVGHGAIVAADPEIEDRDEIQRRYEAAPADL
jgi:hypothetical protein